MERGQMLIIPQAIMPHIKLKGIHFCSIEGCGYSMLFGHCNQLGRGGMGMGEGRSNLCSLLKT